MHVQFHSYNSPRSLRICGLASRSQVSRFPQPGEAFELKRQSLVVLIKICTFLGNEKLGFQYFTMLGQHNHQDKLEIHYEIIIKISRPIEQFLGFNFHMKD